ncbi:MAG: hypothetical protein QM594_18225 [Niabella sp.]
MEQIFERPGTLEEAFSLLEKGTSVEVKTMDAIRILQSTQNVAYKVYFNIPATGRSVIVLHNNHQDAGISKI